MIAGELKPPLSLRLLRCKGWAEWSWEFRWERSGGMEECGEGGGGGGCVWRYGNRRPVTRARGEEARVQICRDSLPLFLGLRGGPFQSQNGQRIDARLEMERSGAAN